MAKNLKMANASVNAEGDSLNAAGYNGGKLQVYDGTQPTTADDAVTTQVKLIEWTLPNPCFGSTVAGVLTANAISDVTAIASGVAAWYRCVSSGGTKLQDGSVGAGGTFDLVLDTTTITVGVTQHVTSWTHTIPKS
jgi:hypothetical protein